MKERINTAFLAADILKALGVEDVVLCPGSRNAPLIQAFGQYKELRKHSIVDERSAGFFALGLGLQTKKPAVLVSTSGTAVLNFAPAIAEAYYQKVPLLILTADRPDYLIDQGDGQSMHQQNVYRNYILQSFQLSHRLSGKKDLAFAQRIINQAFMISVQSSGPVHINMPFEEPLYGASRFPESENRRLIHRLPVRIRPDEEAIAPLKERWRKAGRKMIILGQGEYSDTLLMKLEKFAGEDCIILSETLSNIQTENSISGIDKVLAVMKVEEKEELFPEILLTAGGAIVSKKIKSFLREAPDYEHWHVDKDAAFMDTFFHLSMLIPLDLEVLLDSFGHEEKLKDSPYRKKWLSLKPKAEEIHGDFVRSLDWSDFYIFEHLFRIIPGDTLLHLGNSTIVRYAQLFESARRFRSFSNRGTSGIDGSLSTAVGFSTLSKAKNLMITGDLSFFYDSNALMSRNLPSNLKIILINNQGGNIFRFIPGPDTTGFLEEFFEAKHSFRADKICQVFGLSYFSASDKQEFQAALDALLHHPDTALLELFTQGELSARVLSSYFERLAGSTE